MKIDPRAPVLVAAGQVIQRNAASDHADAPNHSALSSLEPLALMEAAARRAAADAECPMLLSRLDSIRVPQGLWPYTNPAYILRDQLGCPSAQTVLAPISGNMVQRMLTDGAREIAAGRRDAVLIVGAEAEHSRRRAKRSGRELHWNDTQTPSPDHEFEEGHSWILPEEIEVGVAHPAAIFSLYENARRHARSESLVENRERIARLWHRFAKVAEKNPFAWTREVPSEDLIREETSENKMNAYPYTKRLCANMVVDLGAAVILCSVELAMRLQIPRDRWVFLHTATECAATPFMSHRMDFKSVPTLELAGRRALELSQLEPGDLAHVDLYSCFPAAVQVAAEALGFPLDDPLTVTGGLAYAGGPFNSYVLHSLATVMNRLRQEPGSLGFISSVGGSFNKHAFGIYSTEPPTAGFQYADLDPEAKQLPRREFTTGHEGKATVETYSLRYTNGQPTLASFSCLLPDGRRTWAKSEAPDLIASMLTRETCRRIAQLKRTDLLAFSD